jgi:hypothetical protein
VRAAAPDQPKIKSVTRVHYDKTEFVAWYNEHLHFANHTFDQSHSAACRNCSFSATATR